MIRSTLLKGIILGFSIAAPVGPIGLLCIQRTIEGGMRKGLASGLGAATADALYGCLAAFGFTALTRLLVSSGGAVGLVGGLALCWLGIRILTSPPAPRAAQGTKSGIGLFPDFASTFILTLSNPMTILFFAAVITGMTDAAGAGSALQGALLVGGVFLGSSAWWFFLSLVVGVFGQRFDEKTRLWVNRLSGALVLGFGLYAMATKGILLFRD